MRRWRPKALGARRLDLLFHRVDNRIEAIRIGTALPVRDVKRLTRLLCDKIETIDPGFGIEIMSLAATLAEPLAPKQTISSLIEEPEADVSGLIDTLANRVGEQQLYRFAPVASDVPERSVQRIAPTAPDTGETWPILAGPLAASLAPAAAPGTDRDGRVAARSSARQLHLARRASPRETRRRPRARLRRMVETRRRADRGARLFPGRGRGGRALLDLPRRRRRGSPPPARIAGSCMGFSDERRRAMPSCNAPRISAFLRGASSCEELFAEAAKLGIEALAIVDRNSLAGIVRAHEAAKATGVRLIVGCRLDLADGMSVLVYPTDRPAYARLCRLLSLGKKRGGKAQCRLDWSDLAAYSEGLIAVLVPDEADDTCALRLRRLAAGLRRPRLYGADAAPAAERRAAPP